MYIPSSFYIWTIEVSTAVCYVLDKVVRCEGDFQNLMVIQKSGCVWHQNTANLKIKQNLVVSMPGRL